MELNQKHATQYMHIHVDVFFLVSNWEITDPRQFGEHWLVTSDKLNLFESNYYMFLSDITRYFAHLQLLLNFPDF